MGSDREQDVEQTATEAASVAAGAEVGPAKPLGATLGRYRLERELGAGAMGVVHAAFDPDLERRIALKVLRGATATLEARDRLLREARAMARLTHPNVVTVYEVGTASGRDFVAMEMIHGETLAEWLRQAKRIPAAIVDAFLAAGRGLAAAHAAGIVHRDFKPHNVLRSRGGRVVVTDFGLAREAEGMLPAALETTLPGGTESSTPSALAGLTVTGSLLGTPAYMAPEQWQGGAVTPATDQFAYCVALWEALAGERPYRGPTFDELRSQVARGPAALDASHIPRRIRGLLRRGLDPDPARRWPSMDALLARLARAQRRPGAAIAIAGGALVAAAVLVFALRPSAPPPPVCEPPARDLATVWSLAIAAELRTKTSEAHGTVLAAAFRDWQGTRAAACTAPPQIRQAQLQCLDGVLGRFDVLRQAYLHVPGGLAEDLQAQLIDPAICRKPAAADVPRLTLTPTPGMIAAYALYGRSQTEHKPDDSEIASLFGASNADPCARVVATLAFDAASQDKARARSLMTDAVGAADQCGDERLRADLLIQDIAYRWELPMIGPKGEAAIRQAQIAATRVMQPDVSATLASKTLIAAGQRAHWDEALRLADTEVAGYRARGLQVRLLRAVIKRNYLRITRREPGDLDAVAADVRTWRPLAVENHQAELARRLDVEDATARFQRGDVAAAHADLIRLWQTQPAVKNTAGSRKIAGEVVDPAGRPVAGARVAASGLLTADPVGIDVPRFFASEDLRDDSLRIATSDAGGHFVIEDAVAAGVIVAELADRRSMPAVLADHVKLVLEPTRSVSGKVDLAGTPSTRVNVYVTVVGDPTQKFYLVAPVAPDGSFAITRAPVGALRVGPQVLGNGVFDWHLEFQTLPASPAPVTGIPLSLALSSRTIDVVVRSAVATPLEGAQVAVFAGKQPVGNLGDLIRLQGMGMGMQYRMAMPVVRENVPQPVLDKIRPGDFVAHVEHVGLGGLTVCALGLTGDLHDPDFARSLQAHRAQLAVKCKQIGPDVSVVVLDVPPQQRFD